MVQLRETLNRGKFTFGSDIRKPAVKEAFDL